MFMKWSTVNSSPDRVNKRRKGRPATLIFLCGLLTFTSACGLLPDEEQEETLPTITSPAISKKPEYTVEKGPWVSTISASGKIMSEDEEPLLIKLKAGGRFEQVRVKNGDNVKAGQTIAVLDMEEKQKELRRKKLELRKTQAEMKKKLQEKDETDPAVFEETLASFEQARQDIADIENDIAKATIRAPFTGIIVNLKAKKGKEAKQYDLVAKVVNTSRFVVALEVPNKDELQKIARNMEVELSINSVSQKLKGKVKALPVLSSNSTNASTDTNYDTTSGEDNTSEQEQDPIGKYVVVQVSEKLPASVSHGTPLSATITIQKRNDVITVPPSTIRTLGSRTYVQVIEGDSKREVDVEVGEQEATKVEIKAGLKPGQKVVGR